ncbi:MAG: tetratricopeptide repeat protein [Woeseiaceae bacterium]|nr:tetratricopeptide repeat protein [Woeseiaceae bacterium]
MSNLFQELKRRNVFRVSIAYVIVSWLLVQVVSTIREPLFLPDWTETLIIVILAIGFPIAIIFAWAFELTPEGLKKTEEVEREASVTALTGRKLNNAIIFALVLALGYFIFERQFLHDHGNDETTEATVAAEQAEGTSIAVLPFADMSPDKDHEYFSDGISEELLNLLAKVPELRVAARTSSFQFKDQNLDITRVAEQLNVKHVLEGSIRKANTRVRITAQLIEAETGYHLWSDTYDRELTDIFGIQDEISAAIVAALSQTLGLVPENAPQAFAAANTEAYNAYLLGQHLIKKRTRADIEAALGHFEKAIELDPDYAPAHAQLALAAYLLTSSTTTYGTFTLDEALSVAEPAVQRALELDPQLAEAHAVKGLLHSAKSEFTDAIPPFEEALRINPSLTDVHNWYSIMLDDMGEPGHAFRIIKDAYAIDPLSVLTLHNYLNRLVERHDFDKAGPVLDRLAQLDPVRAAGFRGGIKMRQGQAAEGGIEVFRGADLDPEAARIRARAAFFLDNIGLREEALRMWKFPNVELAFPDFDDPERVLAVARERYENSPSDPEAYSDLAWAHLLAGDAENARLWAHRTLERLDEPYRDAHWINQVLVHDAWQRGDSEELERRIGPLEQRLQKRVDAGMDTAWMALDSAMYAFVRGDEEAASTAMEKVLSRQLVSRSNLDFYYDVYEFGDSPGLAAIRADYEAYVDEERRKFLAYACGEIGFTTWTPLEGTCKEVEKSSPVPL